jgi:hypothetical protein
MLYLLPSSWLVFMFTAIHTFHVLEINSENKDIFTSRTATDRNASQTVWKQLDYLTGSL